MLSSSGLTELKAVVAQQVSALMRIGITISESDNMVVSELRMYVEAANELQKEQGPAPLPDGAVGRARMR